MKLIEEASYRQTMTDVVEPALAQMREEIFLPLADGGSLYAEAYEQAGARRAVVVLHGYTESCEKFREMIWYFTQAGMNVYAVDHRGHGRSARAVADTSITHVERFSDYVNDLAQFMQAVVLPRTASIPRTLYAHSMGGAVGAMTLMAHPDWFARAVLTAPMLAPESAPYPAFVGQALAGAMVALGRGKARAFIGKPFDAQSETFEASFATGRARFDYYEQKRVAHPHLQNCSPSYSWVKQAIGVTRTLLNPENCRRIKTPLLLCQAGRDTVVRLPEQNAFVSLVPGAQLRAFETAKHEIYCSDDQTMADYVPAVLDFLEA